MADYKETLNLPRTDFEMRAGLARKEPELLAHWRSCGLYERIQANRRDAAPFVLHDGPPYANGHLHHGHILNKILKDIVVKERTMAGYRAAYVPGWDCHGLPIEVQVDKQLGARKAGMSKGDMRRTCREYAASFVDVQRDEFRRLGVFGRWDDPYLTMSHAYEAQILRELAKVAANGLLYKGLRPVNWCTVHRTALAEAEVEYENRESPSIYVAFDLTARPDKVTHSEQPVSIAIWTTTPWTLPANLAVCVHPDFEYVAYRLSGRPCIVARERLASFLAAVGEGAVDDRRVVATWKGSQLAGLSYRHPWLDRVCPVLLAEHVTLDAGTGCVHTAPGHGAEDFEVGRRAGLEVLSPVDDGGAFTQAAGAFAGRKAVDCNADIVKLLEARGALLNRPGETIAHRYPHCWRCHQPILLRATQQWFLALDQPFGGGASLRRRALAALDNVAWVPAWGRDRIGGMLASRPDWCLSRQRSWGVPIAVVYCRGCGDTVVDPRLMNRVADVFESEGADAWFERDVADLLPGLRCERCGGAEFRKEEDILDVWFDSGVSYAAVVEREGLGQPDGPPVDLYLEGSDQHRGWFHSALLCALATRGTPPYRAVLTHGFVVDGDGKKISKSKGNFVDPFKTVAADGAELLRLWVAGEDYREDIRISGEILKRLSETYRKLRNTLRYLLGNLWGFDPQRDLVEPSELQELDRYMVALVQQRVVRIRRSYEAYEFHGVVHTLNEFCTVDLSAFYLDVLKDRLYASPPRCVLRRSAQSALYLIARDLLRVMAPVLCFTAEEAWGHLPKFVGDQDSVHLACFPGGDDDSALAALRGAAAADGEALIDRYEYLRGVRKTVNVALEQARRDKVIGASSSACVTLGVPEDDSKRLEGVGHAALRDLFIVSQVDFRNSAVLEVRVQQARGRKCARCWLYGDDVGSSARHPDVCGRCAEALQ